MCFTCISPQYSNCIFFKKMVKIAIEKQEDKSISNRSGLTWPLTNVSALSPYLYMLATMFPKYVSLITCDWWRWRHIEKRKIKTDPEWTTSYVAACPGKRTETKGESALVAVSFSCIRTVRPLLSHIRTVSPDKQGQNGVRLRCSNIITHVFLHLYREPKVNQRFDALLI